MATFEYKATKTFEDILQIDDIGNCAIRCEGTYKDGRITNFGEYYLITKTVMGVTSILKFGPIIPDIPYMPTSFESSFEQLAFKEPQIEKKISMFINDGFYNISVAESILPEVALERYPSAIITFENL